MTDTERILGLIEKLSQVVETQKQQINQLESQLVELAQKYNDHDHALYSQWDSSNLLRETMPIPKYQRFEGK